MKKPVPWYEWLPQKDWTQEDYAYARRDGWQGTEPRPIEPMDLPMPAVPEHLGPTWSPLSAPVNESKRAADAALRKLGIR